MKKSMMGHQKTKELKTIHTNGKQKRKLPGDKKMVTCGVTYE